MLSSAPLRELSCPRVWLALWIAAIVAAIVLSLAPVPRIDLPIDHFDKLEHAGGYALLAAFAAMLFKERRALLMAMLGLLGLGLLMELVQAMIPWRTGDPLDVLANTAGILLGAGVAATPLARSLVVVERWLKRVAGPR
jgi:VanZ family protein